MSVFNRMCIYMTPAAAQQEYHQSIQSILCCACTTLLSVFPTSTYPTGAFNRSTALHFHSPPRARWFNRRENSYDVMRSVSLSAIERIYPLAICEAKYNVSGINRSFGHIREQGSTLMETPALSLSPTST
jgi:hypothetical protein